jgi:hypothetical protein
MRMHARARKEKGNLDPWKKKKRLKKPIEACCQQAAIKNPMRLGLEVVVTEPRELTTTTKKRGAKSSTS